MQARMQNPAVIIPEAMPAILNVFMATKKGGVPEATLELVHLRASQINGCTAPASTRAYAAPRRPARATSGCSRWRPGGRHPTSPTPNGPPSR